MLEYYIEDDYTNVKLIIELLLKAKTLRVLAYDKIRYNSGSKTPGIDGRIGIQKNEFEYFIFQGFNEMKNDTDFRVKRVYINKEDGTKRPLGILNFRNRVIQEILRIAIDAIVEYQSSNLSFGFRTGRSTHYMLQAVEQHLHEDYDAFYSIDLTKCFDRISHDKIINKLEG